MNNKEQSAGTIAGQSTEAEVTNVSHNNGNTNVVCSQSRVSSLEEMSSIRLSKEYLEKRNRFFDSFFDEQFKRLGQDSSTP